MLIYLRIKTVPVLLKSNACLPHTKEVKSIFENKSSNSLPLSMILATKNSMLRESRRERAYMCVSHFSATDPLLFCAGFHDLKCHFESHHPKLHTHTYTHIQDAQANTIVLKDNNETVLIFQKTTVLSSDYQSEQAATKRVTISSGMFEIPPIFR